jgi:cyd operon protein YbgT
MWYFAWILGIGFATGAAVIAAVFHELRLPDPGRVD